MTAASSSSSTSTTNEPVTGLSVYEARRAQWLSPSTSTSASTTARSTSSTMTPAAEEASRARLESVLSRPGAEEDDKLWDSYLCAVHRGLVSDGKRFRRGIRLDLAVKILKAGWLRDGTWEVASAASSVVAAPELSPPPSATPSAADAGSSTPAAVAAAAGPRSPRSRPFLNGHQPAAVVGAAPTPHLHPHVHSPGLIKSLKKMARRMSDNLHASSSSAAGNPHPPSSLAKKGTPGLPVTEESSSGSGSRSPRSSSRTRKDGGVGGASVVVLPDVNVAWGP